MIRAVYLPLVLPLFAVPLLCWLSGRLRPALASWLVLASALMLGASALAALGLLVAAALAVTGVVARLGHWSTADVRQEDVVHLPADLIAGLLLVVFGVAAVSVVVGRLRALVAAHRIARDAPAGSDLLVLEDDRPIAHALPGRPGRIVVSTGMLAMLTPTERRALLAHERAHLAHGHHLFVAAVDVLATAVPLLRPLTGAVRYTTERWADEIAAGQVGDRTTVARAVGKAALAGRAVVDRTSRIALGAATGPVPRRVAALLAAPPVERGRWPLLSRTGGCALVAVVLLVGSVVFAAHAAADLHAALELAQH